MIIYKPEKCDDVAVATDIYAAFALVECMDLARRYGLGHPARSELTDIAGMVLPEAKIDALATWAALRARPFLSGACSVSGRISR